jgi:hypothetical protein
MLKNSQCNVNGGGLGPGQRREVAFILLHGWGTLMERKCLSKSGTLVFPMALPLNYCVTLVQSLPSLSCVLLPVKEEISLAPSALTAFESLTS